MERLVKYKFPVGYNLATTREDLRGLYDKELHPESPKVAIINDMFKKGYKFKELPFIIPVQIESILCKTDYNKCRERILYYCKTPYSEKCLFVNEERLFKISDKAILEEIQHDSDKPLGASQRLKLLRTFCDLEKRYDAKLATSVHLPDSIILKEGTVPDNMFFSNSAITNPIFVDIGKHDIRIDKYNNVVIQFNTLISLDGNSYTLTVNSNGTPVSIADKHEVEMFNDED